MVPIYMHFWGKARPAEARPAEARPAEARPGVAPPAEAPPAEAPPAEQATSTAYPRWHLLPFHSLDVAAVGAVLWNRLPHARRQLAKALAMNETRARGTLLWLLAIHDLGKFSRLFQNLCEDARVAIWPGPQNFRRANYRHDGLGFKLWRECLCREVFPLLPHAEAMDWERFEDFVIPQVSAVTGHHGKPPQSPDTRITRCFLREEIEAAEAFVKDAIALLRPDFSDWRDDGDQETALRHGSYLVAGFTVLCDWLGSNQDYFPYHDEPEPLETYWRGRALPRAEKAVRETLLAPPPVATDSGMAYLFPQLAQPTSLQSLAGGAPLAAPGPDLFILEDLTGSGKTEAALVLAQKIMAAGRADGLYFALPTMATADQMYDRVSRAYRRFYRSGPGLPTPTLVLAHGSRDLSKAFRKSTGMERPRPELGEEGDAEPASALCSQWLADNRKKALLGAVGVGTVDQAMLAVMPCKHHALRLWGLCNKVLILDEIHAYDAYMLQILKTLIRFHTAHGGSTLLLSATLSMSMRRSLVEAYRQGLGRAGPEWPAEGGAFPLFTQVTPERVTCAPSRPQTTRTVRVTVTHESPAATIAEHARAGRCVCWIRNTVDDALDGYREICAALGSEKTRVFHARFALGHRLALQEMLLNRFGKQDDGLEKLERQGWVVVATQVVEQSLDLDFDVMVSDLAPIDLLIQRVGRLCRHPRDAAGKIIAGDPGQARDARGTPELTVFAPPFSETPDENWYAQTFPRANHVYQHTLVLWHSLQQLRERGEIRLPEQSRELIEAVYDPQHVPPGLENTDIRMAAEASYERNRAAQITLGLATGYGEDQAYEDPEDLLTRLSLPTRTLRLATWDGAAFQPLVNHGEFPWAMSEIRVRAYHVHRAAPLPPERETAYQALSESLPDKNRSVIFVPLTKHGETYRATVLNEKGDPVGLCYSPTTGLTFEPREGGEQF